MSAADDPRLEVLLDRYVDEAISDEQKAELEAALLASPAARELFWRRTELHALLRRHGEESWGTRMASPVAPRGPVEGTAPSRPGRTWFTTPRLRWLRPSVALLTAGALATALVLLGPRHPAPLTPIAAESASTGVAVLTRAVDVVWTGAGHRLGEVLSPGRLEIGRGLVQIDFYSGAQVILEGPARVDLVAANEVVCHLGRLRGQVPPPARGFRVRSHDLELVDLGTSFGLEVKEGGTGEVHVFDGKVQVAPASAPERRRDLEQGESLGFGAGGPGAIVDHVRDAFPTAAQLDRVEAEVSRARLAAWSAETARLLAEAQPLLHFGFEDVGKRTIMNAGTLGPHAASGTVVGAAAVTGRWPGKRAVEFRRVSDRVRVAIPGEYTSLTMVAWVRVDSLPNQFHGLVMTDGFEVGHPHWQIRQSGRVSFSVRDTPDGPFLQTLTPPLIVPELFGQWVQLAVVHDRAALEVTQYMNGKPVARLPIERPVTLRLETSELGNWGLPFRGPDGRPHPTAIRNLAGAMDELSIFDRALTDADLARLFEAGDPYRPFGGPK
jgi:hypothetical protein